MTGRIERVEVITGVERRRRWSVLEKLRLVAESQAPGSSVSRVARRQGISPNQLLTCRRLAAEGALRSPELPPVLVPVELRGEPSSAPRAASRAPLRDGAGVEVIEVELPNGCRLRFDGRIQTTILRKVVDVLRGVRR